jgi:hypothetical protein
MIIPTEVIDLLLCCASVDPKKGSKLEALISRGVDWNLVIEQGQRHEILPLLYWSLKAHCPDKVPDTIMKELGELFQENARKNLFAISELLRILGLLEKQGIKAIPFKGPVLTSVLYENPGLRCYGDLDILIPKSDFLLVKEVLSKNAYLPLIPINSNPTEAIIFRANRQYNFFRQHPEVHLEIHWGIAPIWFFASSDYEPWWDRVEQISLGGEKVSSFSAEILFILLCIHGAKHHWLILKWISDLARLIKIREINWLDLMELASRLKCQRMIYLGLLLAKKLLDAPVPIHIINNIEKDDLTLRLSREVQESYYSYDQPGIITSSIFLSKVQDGWFNRSRVCFGLCLTPTMAERESFPLPEYLHFFYYPYRPIRLMKKHIWGPLRMKKTKTVELADI